MIDLQYISLESEPQSAASDDPGRDDKEFQQSKLARWSELKERLADYRADFIQTKVSDSDHSCHMAGTTEVDSPYHELLSNQAHMLQGNQFLLY